MKPLTTGGLRPFGDIDFPCEIWPLDVFFTAVADYWTAEGCLRVAVCRIRRATNMVAPASNVNALAVSPGSISGTSGGGGGRALAFCTISAQNANDNPIINAVLRRANVANISAPFSFRAGRFRA